MPATVRVDIDVRGLYEVADRLRVAPLVVDVESEGMLTRSLETIKSNVQARTPVRRGRLLQSITAAQRSAREGKVYTNVYYAPLVERGRGPVRARGRALRFEVVTGFIFRKSVREAKGRWMFLEGRDASLLAIRRIVSDGARAVTRFIAGK